MCTAAFLGISAGSRGRKDASCRLTVPGDKGPPTPPSQAFLRLPGRSCGPRGWRREGRATPGTRPRPRRDGRWRGGVGRGLWAASSGTAGSAWRPVQLKLDPAADLDQHGLGAGVVAAGLGDIPRAAFELPRPSSPGPAHSRPYRALTMRAAVGRLSHTAAGASAPGRCSAFASARSCPGGCRAPSGRPAGNDGARRSSWGARPRTGHARIGPD